MAQVENLQQNDTYVSELAEALRSQVSLSAVPGMLKQVIKNDMWKRRIVRQTKQPIEYKRFSDFVKDLPPDGLGTNMNVLMSLCRFHEDIEAVDLLASVSTGQQGERTDLKPDTPNIDNNVHKVEGRLSPTGNSAAATMRRLNKDYPAIHERVLSGELSPNKAALEAGFRQSKLQLPTDASAAGRYLAKKVDNDWMIACYDAYTKAQDKE